jgi:hypothetical protein
MGNGKDWGFLIFYSFRAGLLVFVFLVVIVVVVSLEGGGSFILFFFFFFFSFEKGKFILCSTSKAIMLFSLYLLFLFPFYPRRALRFCWRIFKQN